MEISQGLGPSDGDVDGGDDDEIGVDMEPREGPHHHPRRHVELVVPGCSHVHHRRVRWPILQISAVSPRRSSTAAPARRTHPDGVQSRRHGRGLAGDRRGELAKAPKSEGRSKKDLMEWGVSDETGKVASRKRPKRAWN
ncbi:hypothetical protein B296_00031622 [Ensete ventricosum]|uniref:DUF834 domain-containing protein n=1 Tax=Ensete ventricosum TaxID=4639 RepID=A0A427AB17_ENSVE|nr:hypothetical protein B296_00031622 [Ensete ventricosum]